MKEKLQAVLAAVQTQAKSLLTKAKASVAKANVPSVIAGAALGCLLHAPLALAVKAGVSVVALALKAAAAAIKCI